MKLNTVVEVLTAAHLAYLVTAPKEFAARGGLMFVAPPGQFKTVITKTLDAWQPQAMVLSDLTIRQLVEMRGEISAGNIRTMGFAEFPKLYSRNQATSLNLEGALHQMADEGFRLANYEDSRLTVRESRAMIVGAMPDSFYTRHWAEWIRTGFARRFLWCHFQLADSEIIIRALRNWEPIRFGKILYQAPTGSIPFSVSEQESLFIESILRHCKIGVQAIPYILMKKITSVLKWRYSELGKAKAARKAMEIIGDFGPCLSQVVDLEIPEQEDAEPERKRPNSEQGIKSA